MRPIAFILTGLLCLAAIQQVRSQSPNLEGATARLTIAGLQQVSEKGQANGYAPLNDETLIDPAFVFPGFADAEDGTVWSKSGTSIVPRQGLAADTTGLTSVSIRLGGLFEISPGQWISGIGQLDGAGPLYIRAGDDDRRVFVGNNQTIGEANSGVTGFLWSIGHGGAFKLGGGEFAGNLDLNGNSISEVVTISGTGATLNLAGKSLAVTSGSFTISTPGGGLVIATAALPELNTTLALNTASASTIFGRKDQTNTWNQLQTFSVAPAVPDDSFAVGKVSGLQAALDARLALVGGTMSGTVNFGGLPATNLGAPVSSGDAVTRGYLESNYTSTAASVRSVSGSAPVTVSSTTGTIAISMPVATGTTNGYLSSTDWNTFNSKQSTISASSPLSISESNVSIQAASGTTSGYLTSSHWILFNSKQNALTAESPMVLTGSNTVAIQQATSITSGYLSSAHWNAFNDKQSRISVASPLSLSGTQISISAASTNSSGYLSSADWNTFNSKQSTMSAASPLVLTGTQVSIPLATGTSNGYLSSPDWSDFNSKQSQIAVAAPLVLTGTQVSIPLATGSASGYLSSTDWARFNAGVGAVGTVTSVGLLLPTAIFTNGSPVSTTGNLTATLKPQLAMSFFAGPVSGSSAVPTFRAIAATDMPTAIPAVNIGTGAVDNDELGYLNGVTSSIQTQLNGKQPLLVSGTTNNMDLSGYNVTLSGTTEARDSTARTAANEAKNGWAPYSAGTVSGTATFNFSNGPRQSASVTGDVVIAPPSNGADGNELRLRLTVSGTVNRTLNFDAAILKPSDSGLTLPKTLTAGKAYRVMLSMSGTSWELVSLVGGY